MVFLCFSSDDRHSVVKSCLYHLKNYGIETWYDYHQLIIGDNKKKKNFESAINKCNYFIIIYSQNFFNSPCALIEEQLIFNEAEKRGITIFPLLYNLNFSELPSDYKSKIDALIYNEISNTSGALLAINQIITKILIDRLQCDALDLTPEINQDTLSDIQDSYIKKILTEYLRISSQNFNARIAILFSIFTYIDKSVSISIPYTLKKIMEYLFSFTYLDVTHNHKELIIAELVIIHCLKLIQ